MIGRCFIVHSELGVFMGQALGLGFFSNLGDGGLQTHAPIFENLDEAKAFAADFDPEVVPGFVYFGVPAGYSDGEKIDSLAMQASGVPLKFLDRILENEAMRNAIVPQRAN